MLTIDGARGEGGGQVLRSALGLSLLTGTPFRIENIRARRKTPGLRRQHLEGVRAAARIGRARVEGATLGATDLTFWPGEVTPETHEFSVPTAGSMTLVLQTVLPALITASGPSRLILSGGTHNPMAPPYDFLAETFFPVLRRMGVGIEARLERHGFYPAGGGRFCVDIAPARALAPVDLPVDLVDRGPIIGVRARALVARLPLTIAQRELAVVARMLGLAQEALHAGAIADSAGPGNVVMIAIESRAVTEIVTGFGERGVRAEDVAARAAGEAARYLDAGVPVGEHLADQLLIPMAMAGRGRFRTLPPSDHTTTNAAVVQAFLGVDIRMRADGDACMVELGPGA